MVMTLKLFLANKLHPFYCEIRTLKKALSYFFHNYIACLSGCILLDLHQSGSNKRQQHYSIYFSAMLNFLFSQNLLGPIISSSILDFHFYLPLSFLKTIRLICLMIQRLHCAILTIFGKVFFITIIKVTPRFLALAVLHLEYLQDCGVGCTY